MARHGMTGYGRGEADAGETRVVVEAKSVNHRYLDVRISMPRKLSDLEPAVLASVKSRLGRGRVEITVRLEGAQGAGSAALFVADQDAARGLLAALHQVQNALGLPGDITISDMAALADRFLASSEGPDGSTLAAPLHEAVELAVESLVAARAKEGESLFDDLRGQADALEAGVSVVAARAPELVEEARSRLRERIGKLLEDTATSLDAGRLEQEIALLADRSDVHEELQRLRHHIEELRRRLDEPGDEPTGRRIDFLAQELGREVNTIGSKIADPSVSSTVVEMKAAVERIREQVQNLE